MRHPYREPITVIGEQLRRVVGNLRRLGYCFASDESVLPGPQPDCARVVDRISRAMGEVPNALVEFWLIVGSVDLQGSHPEWTGCEYPDPLVVYPASIAEMELDEFLSDEEERLRSEYPYCIPISPDFFHKEDVSGGMYYNVTVPADADDPRLNDEWHATTFRGYLNLSLEYGGFSGLATADDHTWPLDDILFGI